jgi:hypothetical protein
MNDGPPTTTHDIQQSNNGRQYPNTPMPKYQDDNYDADSDDDSDTESDRQPKNSLFESAIKVLFIAIAVAHLWTVWTLRADMNIMMQFQNEIGQQNKHITDLLHNQHQVKWQIVPHHP